MSEPKTLKEWRMLAQSNRREIERLEKENERLRTDASEVFIEEMVLKDGTFDATMRTGIGPIFCQLIKEMMRSTGAENFTTFQMRFSDGSEPYYVTAGRALGLSVDEKYGQVCKERDRLQEVVRRYTSGPGEK